MDGRGDGQPLGVLAKSWTFSRRGMSTSVLPKGHFVLPFE